MTLPQTPNIGQVSKQLKTSSAVVPALLLSVVCIPAGLAAAAFSTPPIQYAALAIAVSAVVLAIGQIIFFTIFDRDRLHNEDHIERKMMIGRMEPEFGSANEVIVVDSNRAATQNPKLTGDQNV